MVLEKEIFPAGTDSRFLREVSVIILRFQVGNDYNHYIFIVI
jgi:hypothetical protein